MTGREAGHAYRTGKILKSRMVPSLRKIRLQRNLKFAHPSPSHLQVLNDQLGPSLG